MNPKVIANASCAVSVDGVFHTILEGQALDVDNPIVKAHPWAFETPEGDGAPAPRRRATKQASAGRRGKVEAATADPADLA